MQKTNLYQRSFLFKINEIISIGVIFYLHSFKKLNKISKKIYSKITLYKC